MDEEVDKSKVRVESDIHKFKKYRMALDVNWNWQKKKLGCRIRPENADPAKDALREVFAELAGTDLNEILNELKAEKKLKEQDNKVLVDHEADKTFKELLTRSRVLGATKLTIEKLDEIEKAKSDITQNVLQQFAVIPKSPSKRVILEIQRERAKPLRLPDQDRQKIANEKLEKQRAKQRAARMAAMEQSAKDEEALNITINLGQTIDPLYVLAHYHGDKFSTGGEYLDGMLYLSRMADATEKLQRTSHKKLEETENVEITSSKEKLEAEKNIEKDFNNIESENELESVEYAANHNTTNAKLHCAASLCNWSRNPANASRLASEGAVRAINLLAMEPTYRITMYCAAAYRHMSEHLELAVAMIDEIKTISTISEMISSTSDDFIAYNLSIALVNLTRVNGKEGVIVDAAIVLALMNLTMIKPELSSTCVRGLYNLTCVDSTYTSIERVIRALVSLSLSGTSNVKHLCAAALCNLSDLKSVRGRMVEEGAINVLSSLARGAETRTRRVCAVILQNLSAARSVRVEMASRGSVAVAYSLSSDQDPIILRCIGLTLSRLAMEATNCQKIIHESGVAALGSIAVKYPTIPGISQPVASAFQLLSSNQSYRVNIVNEGSVTAIASLLRSSVDIFTLQNSLLALCNLLCETENHLPIIQQGLILTLISMCDHSNDLIKDLCSLAFLNLSCAEDSRKHLVNAGAVVAIINIASQNSIVTKKRCAATLCNLTYFSAGMARMVSDGIIPSIVQLVLAKDILTVHYSCAALCRLCCTVENSRLILESGAVPNLVHGAKEGDQVTKQFCGAVLSSLSYYESCRVNLCELGAISALKGLAELNDETTKQRCLVAFANLSCEVSVQVSIIKEGVVSIIAELANSLKEVTYICCAKAICNLACNADNKLSVAKDGGVHALLMISMVQSVDPLTKLLCVIGLNNLLDHTTIDFMLEEGLIGSIANLSKLGGAHISMLSAKIFNHLTQFDAARAKMVERKAVLSTLYNLLCESTTAETQVIAIRTTCNLILDPHVRGSAILAGAYVPIEKGIDIEDRYTVMQCLVSLFSVCNESKHMELMAKGTLPATLLNLVCLKLGTTEDEYKVTIKILAMLSWDEKSRLFMQKTEVIEQIIKLINQNLLVDSIPWLASTLRFIVLGYPDMQELIKLGILPTMLKLHDGLSDIDPFATITAKFLVHALRSLSSYSVCINELAIGGALNIITRAAKLSMAVGSNNCNEIMYEIAVLMYLFSSHSTISRSNSSSSDGAFVLSILSKYPNCYEILAVTIGYYMSDSKYRGPFAIENTALIILKIIDAKKYSDGTASNLVLAIYGFSKINSCRDFLLGPNIQIDKVLNKLSLIENPKIKANITRAFKNLNSDATEAIEEGAVATLIAMSLEGKLKNHASDEFMDPYIENQKEHSILPPDCINDINPNPIESQWFEKVKVTNGGAAGKGPEPPEPPSMIIDGSSEYPTVSDELDIITEIEGKTKMAFAKMQVPHNVKELHLLSDTDFMLNAERESEDISGSSLEETTNSLELLDNKTNNNDSNDDIKPTSPKQLNDMDNNMISQKTSPNTNNSNRKRTSSRTTRLKSNNDQIINGGTTIDHNNDISSRTLSPESSPMQQRNRKNHRNNTQLKPISQKDSTVMVEKAVQLGLFT